jgi:hypothetical protein
MVNDLLMGPSRRSILSPAKAPGRCKARLASSPARFEPASERCIGFARPSPGKKILDGNVFIERRPMDTITAPDEAPVIPLGLRSMGKPGIPRERNRQRPTIHQIDDQRIVRDPHVLGQDRPQLSR